METDRVLAYDTLGETHWWLTGKYAILRDVLHANVPPGTSLEPLLDAGCAGGAFLRAAAGGAALRFGLDTDVAALRRCAAGSVLVTAGEAARLPFADGAFALLSAIDILEHLPDDAGALAEFHRVIRPGGWLLLCVPAFPALFGRHDRLFGHLRRYTRGTLCGLVRAGGFAVTKATYLQPLFFPLLWLKRRWLPMRDPLLGDFGKPRPFGNRLLHTLLAAERFPLRYLDFPFGATLIVLARKPV